MCTKSELGSKIVCFINSTKKYVIYKFATYYFIKFTIPGTLCRKSYRCVDQWLSTFGSLRPAENRVTHHCFSTHTIRGFEYLKVSVYCQPNKKQTQA